MQTDLQRAEINIRRYAALTLRRLRCGGPVHRRAARRLADELESVAAASEAARLAAAQVIPERPEQEDEHAA